MALTVESWDLVSPGEPFVRAQREVDPAALGPGRALVEVAGCGVCHTDLSFAFEGVRTRHPLPLTLGHEISGRVVAAGEGAGHLVGRAVIVPAVLPCGECAACRAGRGAICPAQVFPGNDDHGGFASHVLVPSRGLCAVDEERLARSGVQLPELAVIADAVTTPFQALLNARLGAGELAIFVGAGGVGGFGVQLARALGASVVALDVDAEKLERAAAQGAGLVLDARRELKELKKEIGAWAKAQHLQAFGWRIFETSGTRAGQELAFSLLGYGGHLGVVGFTRDAGTFRLSNLMAFDATARGTWGCLPENYPAVVDLVLDGKVRLDGHVESRPMSRINETFHDLRTHALKRRPVLLPDFA